MSADVVVGAGVIGSSIAHELVRAGRRVVVVDKAGGVGHGSTSASSAVVRFNFSTHAGVATAWESQFCWRHWAEHLGCDVGALARFERSGLAMLDVDLAPRGGYVRLFEEVGVPYEEWDELEAGEELDGGVPAGHVAERRHQQRGTGGEHRMSVGLHDEVEAADAGAGPARHRVPPRGTGG